MKRYTTSLVNKKCKFKPQRYPYTLTRMIKKLNKNIDIAKYQHGGRAIGMCIHCSMECKMVQPFQKRVWQFLTKLNTHLPYEDICLPKEKAVHRYL